jgi:hypothetical protein
MNIVFSRSISSDSQPKNGRVRPFIARSIVNAKVRAGKVRLNRLTCASATPYSCAPQLDFNEICPKSRKVANESKTLQDPLAGVYGSLVNNNIAFVTLKSFDGQ